MKIIVNTNKYSGNFEREMCAAATSQIGECEVGMEFIDYEHLFKNWWEENIIQNNDDGCYRPVTICQTEGFINDGMGGNFRDTPENRLMAIESAIQKMIDYQSSQKKMATDRLKNSDFEASERGWTKEACLRTLKQMDEKIEQMRKDKKIFPAYQSIEIKVKSEIPENIFNDFIKRIYRFAENQQIDIINIIKIDA